MIKKLVALTLLILLFAGASTSALAAPIKETPDDKRKKVVDLASVWIGSNVKYFNNSKSKIINLKNYDPQNVPSSITLDCSSFSASVFLTALNVRLPRTADEQKNAGTAVPYSINKDGTINGDLKTGDLIFLDYEKDSTADHVMIYSGNQYFIQMGGRGIRKYHFTTVWTNNRPVGKNVCSIRRIIQ